MATKIWILYRIHYEYNDEYYYCNNTDVGKPVAAYTSEETAEYQATKRNREFITSNPDEFLAHLNEDWWTDSLLEFLEHLGLAEWAEPHPQNKRRYLFKKDTPPEVIDQILKKTRHRFYGYTSIYIEP